MSHSSLTSTTGSDFVLLSTGTAQSCVSGAAREVREVAMTLSHLWQTSAVRGRNGGCPGCCPGPLLHKQHRQLNRTSFLSLASWPYVPVQSWDSCSNLQVIPWAGNCTIPCYSSNGLWVGSWGINHCTSGCDCTVSTKAACHGPRSPCSAPPPATQRHALTPARLPTAQAEEQHGEEA